MQKPTDVEKRRAEVARLYWEDKKTQIEIADALKVKQSTVSRDIGVLKKRWAAQGDSIAAPNLQSAWDDIRWAKQEAKKGWLASRETQLSTTGKRGKSEYAETQTTVSAGDPRFLQIFMVAVDREIKLFGLDQSNSVKLSDGLMSIIAMMGLDVKEVMKSLEFVVREMASDADLDENGVLVMPDLSGE